MMFIFKIILERINNEFLPFSNAYFELDSKYDPQEIHIMQSSESTTFPLKDIRTIWIFPMKRPALDSIPDNPYSIESLFKREVFDIG